MQVQFSQKIPMDVLKLPPYLLQRLLYQLHVSGRGQLIYTALFACQDLKSGEFLSETIQVQFIIYECKVAFIQALNPLSVQELSKRYPCASPGHSNTKS